MDLYTEDLQMFVDQPELIYISSVRIQDVI